MNWNFLKRKQSTAIERTEHERIIRYVADSIFVLGVIITLLWWLSQPVEFEMSISLNNGLASNVLNSIAPDKFNLTNVTLPDSQNMITVKGKAPFFVLLSLD